MGNKFSGHLNCFVCGRVVRFTLYGTACISATLAFGFACTQLAAGLANVPNSIPVKQSLEVCVPPTCFVSACDEGCIGPAFSKSAMRECTVQQHEDESTSLS